MLSKSAVSKIPLPFPVLGTWQAPVAGSLSATPRCARASLQCFRVAHASRVLVSASRRNSLVWESAGCQPATLGSLPRVFGEFIKMRARRMLPAGCRQLRAGSPRSPEPEGRKSAMTRRHRQHARRVRYPEAFVMSSEVETPLAIQSQRFLDHARNDKLANQIRSNNDHDFEGRALSRP